MLKIDYDLAPFISAISNMGIGIQATKGEYIRSNEESRIKYKHGSLIKNFDISWASSMTYPAVRIDFDNIDLNEDGTSLNFIESIIGAFKLSDHLDLEYDIFKIDENDNIEDTLCHGNMKYDANLCLLKESILDAIEDLHDNRYTLFIRYPKYAWNAACYTEQLSGYQIHNFLINFKDSLSIRYDKINSSDIIKVAHRLFGMQNSKITIRLPKDDINCTVWQFDDFVLTITNKYSIVTIHDMKSSNKLDKFIRYINSIPGALVRVRNSSCNLNFKELPLSSRRSLIREDLEYMKDIIAIKEKENV